MSSPVADYFAGKTLMLTGGTGFIGKVLVEKLLRCCPDVEKIYLLIRPKAGKDPVDRIKKEFSDCKVSDSDSDSFCTFPFSILYGSCFGC